jgi:uncharacterized Tic20 family protein
VNHQIPLKFRAIAAGLQAIATLPAASVVISFSSWFIDTRVFSIMGSIFGGFIVLATVFIIPSPIIVWILWRFTKNIHPFIDKSGRNAINYALNSFLALLFTALFSTFIFAVTCGSGLVEIGLAALSACAIAFYCVAIAYFISSLSAGITVLNGSYFKSGFIYPFVSMREGRG